MGIGYKFSEHLLSFSRSTTASGSLLASKMSKSEMNASPSAEISKTDVEQTESVNKPSPNIRGKDKAAELLASNERIIVTSEENKRVLRKIDLIILPILLSVYFLQSLDKTTLSYASVFGLIRDAKLDPNSQQYSWLGSIVYVAQLVMQPLVAVLLVKIPMGKFLGVMVFTWGCILCGMAGATNFTGLMVTRFLLGTFESAVGKSTSLETYYHILMTASARLHRSRPDVVQAHRTDKSQCRLVRHARHRQHPRQSVIVWTWPHPIRSPLLVPNHLPVLWTSHGHRIGLRIHLYA